MKLPRKINHKLKILLEKAESVECKDLYHSEKQYHNKGEVCPVEYKIAKYAHDLRKYFNEA